jgi:hypothetical protein
MSKILHVRRLRGGGGRAARERAVQVGDTRNATVSTSSSATRSDHTRAW